MIRVLFVCWGNICRSPMAEFILKNWLKRQHGDDFYVSSAAISAEEEGNPIYPPARQELLKHGIICDDKRAVQFIKEDYGRYDYILCIEQRHVNAILKKIGEDSQHKVFRLLDFSIEPHDIADPWYTGDFSKAYSEIEGGIYAFLKTILSDYL